jgi:type I restriction enzyme, R subunit
VTTSGWRLQLFGTKGDDGRYHPFHFYSMRQAIEEGFSLDVLRNYTTHKTFWRIEKAIRDDPQFESAKAERAIARFVDLHPDQPSAERGDSLPEPRVARVLGI